VWLVLCGWCYVVGVVWWLLWLILCGWLCVVVLCVGFVVVGFVWLVLCGWCCVVWLCGCVYTDHQGVLVFLILGKPMFSFSFLLRGLIQ